MTYEIEYRYCDMMIRARKYLIEKHGAETFQLLKWNLWEQEFNLRFIIGTRQTPCKLVFDNNKDYVMFMLRWS